MEQRRDKETEESFKDDRERETDKIQRQIENEREE